MKVEPPVRLRSGCDSSRARAIASISAPIASGSPEVPRKIASIGIHISKWVTTHGYALNVDLNPAPFTEWITACGIEDAQFTTMARELERPVAVDEVRPHALNALADVFDLEFDELPRSVLDALRLDPAHERPAQPAAVSK